ncbi:MAG: sugar ABC transporter permease [Devosia nanyangense]|uniref:Sugar ABC transporter permease n=1 Tax=Devosia nanyangense TaxID=1228055 RepID=A0A933NZP2_9HYPH|nr:sugar ABC transporter permease [Devosia nanyangense]
MADLTVPVAGAAPPARRRRKIQFQAIIATIPMIGIAISVFFVAILFTIYWSFTKSGMFPGWVWVGLRQYEILWNTNNWQIAVSNIWFFGAMSLVINLIVGFLLAVFMDQNIRQESLFRSIFLYPFAMSLYVTGLAWQWILDPNLGLQVAVRSWGWTDFQFAPLGDPKQAMIGLILGGTWQGAGVTMAILLAGVRGVDQEIWKAAKIDGIPTWKTYLYIVIPMMRGAIATTLVLQLTGIIRTFDLVVSMTGGGPGIATWMPAMYVINAIQSKLNVGQGSAAATMMLAPIAVLLFIRAIVSWWNKRSAGMNVS